MSSDRRHPFSFALHSSYGVLHIFTYDCSHVSHHVQFVQANSNNTLITTSTSADDADNADNGDLDNVRRLLQKGEDVNAMDSEGDTALAYVGVLPATINIQMLHWKS